MSIIKGTIGNDDLVGTSSNDVFHLAGGGDDTVHGGAGIHMQLLTIPPGARGKAHKHEAHETAIYVLQGEAGTFYGEQLEHHLVSRASDFVYIPANVPHLPYNLSQLEPCVAIVTRTDPNEQESVVLLPDLDAIGDEHPPKRNAMSDSCVPR